MNIIRTLSFLLCIAALLTACKKEYTDYPFNEITSFSVKDTGNNTIKAIIIKDRLLIYWPAHTSVTDRIVPEGLIAQKAEITPQSGQKIPFKEGFEYTVTAQNGIAKKYFLKPFINQPAPDFSIDYEKYKVGGSMLIRGEPILLDPSQTFIRLINEEEQVFDQKEDLSITYESLRFTVAVPNTGTYLLQVINGKYQFEETIKVEYSDPSFYLPSALTLKRGETTEFKINYTLATGKTKITSLKILHQESNVYYELPIISAKTNFVTVQIPADLPLGEYTKGQVTSDLNPEPITKSFSSSKKITVTD